MILETIFNPVMEYVETSIMGLRASVELEVKRFLLKMGLFIGAGFFAVLSLETLLAAAFFYLADMRRFLMPAVWTAAMSLGAGIALALSGRSLGKKSGMDRPRHTNGYRRVEQERERV